jgi:hypothetical protein
MTLMSSSGVGFLSLAEVRAGRNQAQMAVILENMVKEQVEHKYDSFGPAYQQYRNAVCLWIVDVCRYFQLHLSTTHTAIAYLDRLQPDESFSRLEWQMLAITCVVIAAKFSEREEDVPSLETLEEITQQQISTSVILNYELWALRKLSWEMNAYTPHAFVTCYMAMGVVFVGDVVRDAAPEAADISRALLECMDCLATECLIEPRLKRVPGSQLAAALVYMARRYHGVQPWWRPELETLTRCDVSVVTAVVNEIDSLCIGKAFNASATVCNKPAEVDVVVAVAAAAAVAVKLSGAAKLDKALEEKVAADKGDAHVSTNIVDLSSERDVDMTHDEHEAVSFEHETKGAVPKQSPSSIADMAAHAVVVGCGDAGI